MSEYKVYWLTDFLLMNIWGRQDRILVIILSFEAVHTTYKKANKQVAIRKIYSQWGS